MMATEKYIRTLPHVNIGTLGHIDHGKTKLTEAITKILAAEGGAEYKSYEAISKASILDRGKARKGKIVTVNTAYIEYQTKKRHYSHIDCPGHEDYVRNMITGTSQMDSAIFVIAADEKNIMRQTTEHLTLARQIGIKKIVVFLNKCDLVSPIQQDFIEMEVRRELEAHGFPNDTPIVRGSALKAVEGDPEGVNSVKKLIETLDDYIPIPVRSIDKPFLLQIEKVMSPKGVGTVVTGVVTRGSCKPGTELELLGFNSKPRKVFVISFEINRKSLDLAQAGDNVGARLRDVAHNEVHRGQVLAEPGDKLIKLCKKFNSLVYILTKEDSENARAKTVLSGYKPQFFFNTADVTGTITLPEGVVAEPGGGKKIEGSTNEALTYSATIDLLYPVAIEEGIRFSFREGGKTVGYGTVEEILE